MKKTAIITGGTRGIGKAISLTLSKLNFNLILNYLRDDQSANETKELCLQYTENVILIKGNVAMDSSAIQMVEVALSQFGDINLLVNNASINLDKSLLKLEEEDWDTVIDTNLKGTFMVSKRVAKVMIEKSGGQIINIGATTGIKGRKDGINYCASKAGVMIMTKCMAMELGPLIRVNCIVPGFTMTEESITRFDLNNKLEEELASRNIPLNRLADPDEIAAAVEFLISEKGKFINGQKIIIDGGEFMY